MEVHFLLFTFHFSLFKAQMAKLVDALCSGRSARKGVLVRIQFWAPGPLFRGFFYAYTNLTVNFLQNLFKSEQ